MKRLVLAIALVALVASAGSSALAASAAFSAQRSITFDTALAPEYYGAGQYEGVLHLTISPDGVITGYFRDVDFANIRTIAGGLSGNKIWLDLGGSPPLTVGGTFDGRTIVGSTFFRGQSYKFTATPH